MAIKRSGIYRITFNVCTVQSGALIVHSTKNGGYLQFTLVGKTNGGSSLIGNCLVSIRQVPDIVSIRNPPESLRGALSALHLPEMPPIASHLTIAYEHPL